MISSLPSVKKKKCSVCREKNDVLNLVGIVNETHTAHRLACDKCTDKEYEVKGIKLRPYIIEENTLYKDAEKKVRDNIYSKIRIVPQDYKCES